jgi:hypothetical protein
MLKNFSSFLASPAAGEDDATYVQTTMTTQTVVRATTRLNAHCSGRAGISTPIGLDRST